MTPPEQQPTTEPQAPVEPETAGDTPGLTREELAAQAREKAAERQAALDAQKDPLAGTQPSPMAQPAHNGNGTHRPTQAPQAIVPMELELWAHELLQPLRAEQKRQLQLVMLAVVLSGTAVGLFLVIGRKIEAGSPELPA